MFATIIATAAAALSVVVAYRQVQLSRDATHGELLARTMEVLAAEGQRQDRGIVYGIGTRPLNEWQPQEYEAAERVASSFSQLGFLMKHGFVRSEALVDWWRTEIVMMYQIIVPMIDYRRAEENVAGHHVYFEWLARRGYARLARPNWYEQAAWHRLKAKTAGIATPLPGTTRGETKPRRPAQPS